MSADNSNRDEKRRLWALIGGIGIGVCGGEIVIWRSGLVEPKPWLFAVPVIAAIFVISLAVVIWNKRDERKP